MTLRSDTFRTEGLARSILRVCVPIFVMGFMALGGDAFGSADAGHTSSRKLPPCDLALVGPAKERIFALLHSMMSPFFDRSRLTAVDHHTLTVDLKVPYYWVFRNKNIEENPNELFGKVIQQILETEALVEYRPYLSRILMGFAHSQRSAWGTMRDSDTGHPMDVGDFRRGFGYKLLPDDDVAFTDPKYLSGLLGAYGTTASGYPQHDSVRALYKFEKAFLEFNEKYGIDLEPIAFTLTGSDANNLFLQIASLVVSIRKGQRTEGKILVFDESYVASRGELAQFRHFDRGQRPGPWSRYLIPAPVVHPELIHSTGPLTPDEQRSLQFISNTVQREDNIGGILFEPIVGSAAVKAYRLVYVKALQDLARKLHIPILADEILTGGGRTGKAYAFQHYPGFEPEYVTIGKGIGVSALTSAKYHGQPTHFSRLIDHIQAHGDQMGFHSGAGQKWKFTDTTIIAPTSQLWTSTHILQRLTQSHLPYNAEDVGQYLLDQLRLLAVRMGGLSRDQAQEQVRGVGLLLYYKGPAMGRYLPYMTLTREQAEIYLKAHAGHVIYFRLLDLLKAQGIDPGSDLTWIYRDTQALTKKGYNWRNPEDAKKWTHEAFTIIAKKFPALKAPTDWNM